MSSIHGQLLCTLIEAFSVNPEIGFNTFVDINGNKAKDMACPADPTWRKYLADRYAQYASIHPRRLWREDDFSKNTRRISST